MLKASYTVDRVIKKLPSGDDVVFIVDNDVGMSITNDAENVVENVHELPPP